MIAGTSFVITKKVRFPNPNVLPNARELVAITTTRAYRSNNPTEKSFH